MKNRKWKSCVAVALTFLLGSSLTQMPYAQTGYAGSQIIVAKQDISREEVRENGEELLKKAENALTHVIQWKKSELGINKSKHMFEETDEEYISSGTLDWYAFAMGRTGYEDEYDSYIQALEQDIIEKYKSGDGLDAHKATEWHRRILTLLGVGADPVHVGEDRETALNLVEDGTYNRGKTQDLGTQGINGYIWALLCMDAMRYDIPQDAEDTREDVLAAILGKQNEDGGFGLGGSSDIDMTAMALQALAPYYSLGICLESSDGNVYDVCNIVEQALGYLSSNQNDDGRMDGGYGCSSESLAQVIMALCSLGIDPEKDERFVRNDNSLLDALLVFQLENGGFAHEPEGDANSIAGQQAACALAAYIRLQQGERSLYDMRPAMDGACREQIEALENRLEEMDIQNVDEDTLMDCYAAYEAIPAQERCYVYHYKILVEAMKQTGLDAPQNDIAQCMNQAKDGAGTVTQLYTPEPVQDSQEETLDAAKSPQQRRMYVLIIIIAVVLCGDGVIIYFKKKKKAEESWDE